MSDTKNLSSYDAIPGISTPQLGVLNLSKSKWPWIQYGNKKCVLNCLCNLVTTTNYTPSSVTPIINSCANALSRTEFSNLLQSPNIDGHTALYWAIVNCRLDAFWVLFGFISKMSSACSFDLHLACMITSNNEVFLKLKIMHITSVNNNNLKVLRGCPPDIISVQGGVGQSMHQFIATFQFRMFHKRLCILKDITQGFVAAGRIWWLRICMANTGKWCLMIGLSKPSHPVHPKIVFLVEANARETSADFKLVTEQSKVPPIQHECQLVASDAKLLAPVDSVIQITKWSTYTFNELGDWVMDCNSIYLDCHGTLNAKLDVTLL